MAEDLDRAEKGALRFQRRNHDLEEALVSADKKAATSSESASELVKAKWKILDLERRINSGMTDWNSITELEQVKSKNAILEPALYQRESDLKLCQSILRSIQPFLEGKQLRFENGKIVQSESDPKSTLQQSPNSVPGDIVLSQPRIAVPPGTIRDRPASWGPLPRHWMHAEYQKEFKEKLRVLEGSGPPAEKNNSD
ncbi:MAG: hypothetical protein Q9215_004401 [Flavoplaca cf. flavocitrina]